MLSIEHLRSGYGRIEALHGVSLEVRAGEIVALLGANGAGKTTLLRTISGVQPATAGEIRFEGVRIDRMPAHRRVPLGIAQVPEGRQLFTPLSVEDNLRLGAWTRTSADIGTELARIFAMFPMLDALRHTAAGALSGGQQQMLAIGRALMSKPRLILLDEPSMGLAPILVDQILAVVAEL
ncbi:MAG: ABC transporter ATP-binding protein, partial [Rhodoplanes sp.]